MREIWQFSQLLMVRRRKYHTQLVRVRYEIYHYQSHSPLHASKFYTSYIIKLTFKVQGSAVYVQKRIKL